MKLDVTKWKSFLLGKLFDVKYGVNLELNSCEETNIKNEKTVNFVSRTSEHNGVSARVNVIDDINPQKVGLITVAGGGSVLSTFMQKEPFYSGRDLYTLEAKENISDEAKMFIITVIEKNKYKYSYGRQANKTMPFIELKLPIILNPNGTPYIDETKKYSDGGFVPDWDFMKNYIKSLHHKSITTKNKPSQACELKIRDWEEFILNRVFKLKGGFYNKKPEHSVHGTIPFLGSTDDNNGTTEYYSIEDILKWDKTGNEDNTLNKKIYNGNCIAVTVNGSVCNAYYQSETFTCSHDITVFYLKDYELTPCLAEFLCTIIMKDKYRWSYGRKPHDVKKFGKSVIKLPIQHNEDGTPFIDETKKYSELGYIPDWSFMENYIKSLPYGDRI